MALSIDMMDISETEYCNGDYLEVRENNSSGRLFGAFCGKNIPPVFPNANTYWLKFRSDNDGVGRGFRLEYNYGIEILFLEHERQRLIFFSNFISISSETC